MKHRHFEDLPVWKDAARLFVEAASLTHGLRLASPGDLTNQLLRAALSISNNIAEGFERGTTAELITFLYYARGSAGEVRSMLTILAGIERNANLRSEISDLRSRSESISRQLGGWLRSLQNTDIKGHRYLNDATREEYDRRQRADRFIRKLEAMRRGEHASDAGEPDDRNADDQSSGTRSDSPHP